ncbi:ATP-binding protein [candidate division WWE3 bacterium]|uniref:ATP-binding protein n=1 Tax=candidate division WWE3 bacterium TaxID=2053526 RepID=A0A955J328_UNCKA|nr:ATP-binding protein [candidate division WWE3 bacterium]
MKYQTYTLTNFGNRGFLVRVSVVIHKRGLPKLQVLGLPVAEARKIVSTCNSALASYGLSMPSAKIYVTYDHPYKSFPTNHYALALLACIYSYLYNVDLVTNTIFTGSLDIFGNVSNSNICLPSEMDSINRIVGNFSNTDLTSLNNVPFYDIKCLTQLHDLYKSKIKSSIPTNTAVKISSPENIVGESLLDFMALVVAGKHSSLITGPPGVGKTTLAHTCASIENKNVFQLDTLTSVKNLLGSLSTGDAGLLNEAHGGYLLLDDFISTKPLVLDALRKYMDTFTLSYKVPDLSLCLPTYTTLLYTSNLCHCGYLGSDIKECVCPPYKVYTYQQKLCGPTVDRVSLYLSLPSLHTNRLVTRDNFQVRVCRALELQALRYKNLGFSNNGFLDYKICTQLFPKINTQFKILRTLSSDTLSNRQLLNLFRVALTISDLRGVDYVDDYSLKVALSYKVPSKLY